MLTQQQELFSTHPFAAGDLWRSSGWASRGLIARLRHLLSNAGCVALELGAHNAWRLSVDDLVFSGAGVLSSYRPLASLEGLKPSLALDILASATVRLRPDGLAAINCGGSCFFWPVSGSSPLVQAPPKRFSAGDLNWIEPALGYADFCLVRPNSQFAAAGPTLATLIGPVRAERFHAVIDARLFQRALRVGPYRQYAFTPARLWMIGKYLSCEIAAESQRPAFDPSPLVAAVQAYRLKADVEAMSSQDWGETVYGYLMLELENNLLRLRHHRDLITLRAKVNDDGRSKKWRLRSRPFLHALSRGKPARLHLPERQHDPVGIECAGRWMWILAEQVR